MNADVNASHRLEIALHAVDLDRNATSAAFWANSGSVETHPVPVGDVKVSFTVKLSRRLVERLRAYAASTGLTLSEIASRAFSAVLHRGGGRG